MTTEKQLRAAYDRATEAAQAHTTLVLFGKVEALIATDVHGASAQRTAEKIMALCQAERRRQLDTFDRLSGRDAWQKAARQSAPQGGK